MKKSSKKKREIIGPSSPKQEMMLATNADISIIGGAMGCLPASAEFLTELGWKKLSDYQEGDLVAQYDTSTDKLTFTKPLEYVKLPCDSFKRMSARGLDFIMSPEHRVLYWNDGSDKPKTISFEEVVKRHDASKTKGWTGSIKTTFKVESEGFKVNGELVSDDMLRLLVAIQADGSTDRGVKTYIRFSKHRKDIRLTELLERLGIEYTRKVKEADKYTNNTEYEFGFYVDYRPKSFDDFWTCNDSQLKVIVEEFQYWDGSSVDYANGVSLRYSNNDKKDVDFIQYACHSQGYNTSIVQDKRSDKYIGGEHWNINATLRGKGFRRFSNKDGKCEVSEYQSEDGFKYCFVVPTSYFLVRQNNKVFITGNSGKSYISLLFPLKYVGDPYFRGVIFRKTNSELKAQGGLFESALDIYGKIFGLDNLRVQQNELKITFPNGASLKFSYLENDADCRKHFGAQYTFVLFDEANHFSRFQITSLHGRIRSARAKHKMQMVLTCNPDPDWFALEWIKPYLDETGSPNLELDGVIRYYVLDGNTYIWSDSKEDLKERYPDQNAISFTFISARCTDNIPLMEADPNYVSRLMARDHVEVQRYFYGNWFVRPSASGFFKREWLVEQNDIPPHNEIVKTVRAYDLAGTLKSDSNPDPDYTASVKMAKLVNGDYIILEVDRIRARYSDVTKHIISNAQRDGRGVDIVIPTDSGAAGKAASRMLIKEIVEAGYYAVTKATSSSKVDRYRPFSAAAQSGLIRIVKGCCTDLENKVFNDNSFYYTESEQFDGGRKNHDDMVDSTGDAFMTLATSLVIPDINLGSMPSMHKRVLL